ncbi:MAG: hypothetical protein JAZ13_07265 [Candidatus Thiodiazotropha taylori]|nr:hypothetical protein [Candidatus Thiodiazotropha taylori]
MRYLIVPLLLIYCTVSFSSEEKDSYSILLSREYSKNSSVKNEVSYYIYEMTAYRDRWIQRVNEASEFSPWVKKMRGGKWFEKALNNHKDKATGDQWKKRRWLYDIPGYIPKTKPVGELLKRLLIWSDDKAYKQHKNKMKSRPTTIAPDEVYTYVSDLVSSGDESKVILGKNIDAYVKSKTGLSIFENHTNNPTVTTIRATRKITKKLDLIEQKNKLTEELIRDIHKASNRQDGGVQLAAKKLQSFTNSLVSISVLIDDKQLYRLADFTSQLAEGLSKIAEDSDFTSLATLENGLMIAVAFKGLFNVGKNDGEVIRYQNLVNLIEGLRRTIVNSVVHLEEKLDNYFSHSFKLYYDIANQLRIMDNKIEALDALIQKIERDIRSNHIEVLEKLRAIDNRNYRQENSTCIDDRGVVRPGLKKLEIVNCLDLLVLRANLFSRGREYDLETNPRSGIVKINSIAFPYSEYLDELIRYWNRNGLKHVVWSSVEEKEFKDENIYPRRPAMWAFYALYALDFVSRYKGILGKDAIRYLKKLKKSGKSIIEIDNVLFQSNNIASIKFIDNAVDSVTTKVISLKNAIESQRMFEDKQSGLDIRTGNVYQDTYELINNHGQYISKPITECHEKYYAKEINLNSRRKLFKKLSTSHKLCYKCGWPTNEQLVNNTFMMNGIKAKFSLEQTKESIRGINSYLTKNSLRAERLGLGEIELCFEDIGVEKIIRWIMQKDKSKHRHFVDTLFSINAYFVSTIGDSEIDNNYTVEVIPINKVIVRSNNVFSAPVDGGYPKGRHAYFQGYKFENYLSTLWYGGTLFENEFYPVRKMIIEKADVAMKNYWSPPMYRQPENSNISIIDLPLEDLRKYDNEIQAMIKDRIKEKNKETQKQISRIFALQIDEIESELSLLEASLEIGLNNRRHAFAAISKFNSLRKKFNNYSSYNSTVNDLEEAAKELKKYVKRAIQGEQTKTSKEYFGGNLVILNQIQENISEIEVLFE